MGRAPCNKAKRKNNMKAPKKRAALERFNNRHIDQVWKDVRADPEKEDPNGVREDAALPRTVRQPVDEDLPGMGQFYCVETGKYFISQRAMDDHKKSRFYKMRVKQLKGPRPHNQRDAEAAVGLGVDNGKPLGRDPRKHWEAPMALE